MMQRAKLLLLVCSDEKMLWERSNHHECSGATCECCYGMCKYSRSVRLVHASAWKAGAYTLLGFLQFHMLPDVLLAVEERHAETPAHVKYMRDVVVPHAWHTMLKSRVLAFLMGTHPRLGNCDCKPRRLDDALVYHIIAAFENGFSLDEVKAVVTTTDSLVGA